MTILVTGAAGFIGYHICSKLLREGRNVIGIDNFNSYYDPDLKYARQNQLELEAKLLGKDFALIKGDIKDTSFLEKIFTRYQPKQVVNLAAQAGVRYSIKNPSEYIQSNIVGFGNILECCRHNEVKHLIYASSSSVYGGNTRTPFSEIHRVDHPISLYAATKKANEVMAHSYSHLYGIPCTGLRFFTVYGPWGRPDMAPFLFAKAIFSRQPIRIFNHGNMSRDFTFIDDVIEAVAKLIDKPATPDPDFKKESPNPANSWAPYKIFNIGNNKPIPLMEFIANLEDHIGIQAIKSYEDIQPGDVETTSANTDAIESWIGYKPNTSISYGINNFIKWYKEFYNMNN